MKVSSLSIGGIAAATLIPAMALAQANSPARAAGPRSFAQWDKIEITVETKYGNNPVSYTHLTLPTIYSV